ncbi:hypothetical protein GPLA_2567 [Paraglaciecola polaris LMG 21857]|uniref:Uncharacterized protein n=1 Tax=Paraglaciecola polaris LMG 21857 TaxID=1129793 RepID=K7ADR6_9ALTE|nr:hypothetical protein GPLA_2567 [Paraglaciecola polaris LMG 21857]
MVGVQHIHFIEFEQDNVMTSTNLALSINGVSIRILSKKTASWRFSILNKK